MVQTSLDKPKEEVQSKEEPKAPPVIDVRVQGRVNRLMDLAKRAYKRNHPDAEVRWARDPQHDKSMSMQIIHKSNGYKIVKVSDLVLEDDEDIFGGPDEPVRVMDTVMMACSKQRKAERRLEVEGAAIEQATLSDRVYKDSMERRGVKTGGSIKKTYTDEEVKLPEHERR